MTSAFTMLYGPSPETTLAFGLPGGWEWAAILILGLLIFGRRLPEVGRSVGKSVGWLVGWLIGWSVGRSVVRSVVPHSNLSNFHYILVCKLPFIYSKTPLQSICSVDRPFARLVG